MNITKEEIQKFLKDSVEWLEDQQQGCTTLKIDDRLAVCVGWLPGYGDEERDDVIQAKDDPDWAINAGIKVWTSDDMRTDYEFINSPYYDSGEVVETDTSLDPSDKENDFEDVAKWLYDAYAGIGNLDIEEDGRINGEPAPETHDFDDDFEDSYEKIEEEPKEESLKEKKSIKENYSGEAVIDDLIDRAQSMYDEGGYGDIEECVREAIDDGLIYTDDIHALAQHYGTMPDDSELIEGFYEELFNDVYNGVEEHEPEEEEEDDFDFDEEETDESLKEDSHQDDLGLPREVEVSIGELDFDGDFVDLEDYEIDDVLSDYLSNKYGFCHYGFKWKGNPKDAEKIICYDIDWDTSDEELELN